MHVYMHYAMRSIGQGHASMKRFCSNINMPPWFGCSNVVYSHAKKLAQNVTATCGLEQSLV